MNNWRISTFFQDNTSLVKPTSSALAFTAIKAIKGTDEPMYFDVGQTQRIIASLGYPSYSNGVQDVLDYNIKAPLYVSAPSKNGKYGGVFVTKTGTIPFYTGYADWNSFDLEAVQQGLVIGTGDASRKTFTATLPNFASYVAESLTVLINGVSDPLTFDPTPAVGTEEFAGTTLTGSYVLATGVITVTFTDAPALSAVIKSEYDIDISTSTYFTLRGVSKHIDDVGVKVVSNGSGKFTISIYAKDINNNYTEVTDSPYVVSLDPFGMNDSGKNIYIETVLKNSIYLRALDTENVFTVAVSDTVMVALAGGSRGDALVGADIATAYLAVTDVNKYPISVFFDGSGSIEVPVAFSNLRTNLFKRSRFLTVTPDSTAADLISGGVTSKFGLNDRGIYVYCLTWGVHVDVYHGSSFNCPMIGLIAGRHADSINSTFKGGVGPMWIDENGVGGILGASVISLNQDASETQLRQLDTLRLNPVKYDFTQGAMIVSQRTTSSVDSDYSYIGHSGLADYIVGNIEGSVLPYIIGKLNDIFHRANAKANATIVMNSVSNLLYDYYVKCDEENNNADVLNAKKFVITIGVQYTPQSEMIDFIFINSPIGTDIKQIVNQG